MKNKYFSNVSINIILICIILIIAILTSWYGIDFNKLFKKTSSFFESNDNLDKKQKAYLDKCIDGDTFKLSVNNKKIKIRLLAINTPETNHPTKGEELYGKEASNYTCNTLKKAQNIFIQYEKGLSKQDKYKRYLAWVYVDDKLLQEMLVKNGYAEVKYIYAKYTYTDKLLKIESEVKKNHLKIWQDYKEKNYGQEIYSLVYKNDKSTMTVDVNSGEVPEIIENPHKKGYVFVGWTNNNKLYDLSKPLKNNIIVKAIFQKE